MNKAQLIESLKDLGCEPDTRNKLCTSSKLIRCQDNDTTIVAVGGNEKKNDQLHSVVDAAIIH